VVQGKRIRVLHKATLPKPLAIQQRSILVSDGDSTGGVTFH
jgi:Fe2+ transport system protein FeoA